MHRLAILPGSEGAFGHMFQQPTIRAASSSVSYVLDRGIAFIGDLVLETVEDQDLEVGQRETASLKPRRVLGRKSRRPWRPDRVPLDRLEPWSSQSDAGSRHVEALGAGCSRCCDADEGGLIRARNGGAAVVRWAFVGDQQAPEVLSPWAWATALIDQKTTVTGPSR